MPMLPEDVAAAIAVEGASRHRVQVPSCGGAALVRYWPTSEEAAVQLEDACRALAELEAEAPDVTSQAAQTCRLGVALGRGYAVFYAAQAAAEGLSTKRGQAFAALVTKHLDAAARHGAALRAEVEACRREAAAQVVAHGRELFRGPDTPLTPPGV